MPLLVCLRDINRKETEKDGNVGHIHRTLYFSSSQLFPAGRQI